jgi:hypothetical protein
MGYSCLLAQAEAPRVVFEGKLWDFGKIKQGEAVSHEFIFRNEGNAPLRISRVTTSCGCTAALVSEKEILPGKEGRLKVTFDSHGYSGKVIKYIYFESNDPKAPQVELSIAIEVEVGPGPRIELDRYNIDLGISLEGEESSAKFLVKNTGQLELKIDTENPEFSFFVNGQKISFPYKIPAGKSTELEVRLSGRQGRLGLLRDYLLIKCNDPASPTLSIFISRYVVTREQLKELFKKYGKLLGLK